MRIVARSACQTKPIDVALTTKSTENNISKLKIFLSNETKDRRNIK